MGKPAARLGDMHLCPVSNGPVPHVGGPILPLCVPNVLIGGMPAAVSGNLCLCVGPPDMIVGGSKGVFIGGRPAARMGDRCAHGGTIVFGLPTVLIGDKGKGSVVKKEINMLSAADPMKKTSTDTAVPLSVQGILPDLYSGIPVSASSGVAPASALVEDQTITARAAADAGSLGMDQCS